MGSVLVNFNQNSFWLGSILVVVVYVRISYFQVVLFNPAFFELTVGSDSNLAVQGQIGCKQASTGQKINGFLDGPTWVGWTQRSPKLVRFGVSPSVLILAWRCVGRAIPLTERGSLYWEGQYFSRRLVQLK